MPRTIWYGFRLESDYRSQVASSLSLDIEKLVSWKAGIVDKLTGGIGILFKKHGGEHVIVIDRHPMAEPTEALDCDGFGRSYAMKVD